jgi:hypothetical protein
MKTHNYLITVSIDEFNCLHDSGRLRVDWNRIVSVGNNSASPEVAASLLMRLPEFLERDEHNILTLLFQISHGTAADSSSHTNRPDFRYVLRAEDCIQVIPATSQAKSILDSRFAGSVVLGAPVFEEFFEEDFKLRHQERSFIGAHALVSTLVESDGYQIPTELLKLSEEYAGNPDGLLGKLLNYQRRDPMPKEPISGLRDLGRLLTETLPDRKPTDQLLKLGDWLKMRKDTVIGFRPVYSDKALDGILDVLTVKFRLPVHASSYAIFLHWRDLALRAGGLDLPALEEDCRQLSGCIAGSRIVDAIWLLGFSAGFETFASDYFTRLETPHPFGGGKTTGSKIGLLWPKSPLTERETSQTQASTEAERDQQPKAATDTVASQEDPKQPVVKGSVENVVTAEDSAIAEAGVSHGSDSAHSDTPEAAKKVAKKAAKKPTGTKGGRKPKAQDGELFNS